MSQANRRMRALAVVAIALAIALAFLPLLAVSLPPPGTRASSVVVFGAAGDFGGIGNGNTAALAQRLRAAGGSFLLALGDLGYTSDEQGWCNFIKGHFNDVLVVAGNHDTSESGPGDIAQYAVYCPFTLGVPVTAGPGTPGYGYEYYFDYPATNPLVRVIMITPGVTGAINYNYGAGSTHYNWVVSAVTGARSAGIPWVVAGMHKQCIVSGDKSGCDMGQAMFDKLVDLKVDLILQAHAHIYEGSKGLALSGTCPSVLSANQFDPDCVVDDGADNFYTRGAGSVVAILGTGGIGVRSVTLSSTSDRERDYFVELMGSNANTQGKSWGYGYTRFTVSADGITVETDYCPSGTPGSDGQCPAQQATVFKDSFQIGGTPPPPGPLAAGFTFSPASPFVDETVTFASTVSGGTPPYVYAWTFGDGGSASVANPTHGYGSTGTFTATLRVTDAVSNTTTASRDITVTAPPPPLEIPVNAFRGLYYDNEDLTSLKVQRIDNAINFNWGTGTPDPSVAADTFSTRWEGYWDYAQDGIYRFTATTDDGIRVWLDNGTVLDSWIPQSATTYTRDVEVSSGRHDVRVEFFERSATAVAQVAWAYFAPPPQPRPTARFAPSPTYPRPGDTVTFDGSSSTSLNGTLEARWDWEDDGTWDTAWSATLTAQHGFATEGSYTVRLEVRDAGGLTDNETQAVAVDGSAPTTSASLSGTSGSAGWYRSAVAVTLTGVDSLSGVASTTYRLDGGSWLTYASTVSVSADGPHTLEFASTDRAGNAEVAQSIAIKIDATAPTTTHALAGTLGSGSYYVSDVTVTLSASDATSGLASTRYRVDGGSWITYTAAFVVSGNGSHIVEYASTDAAGNAEATRSAPIQIGPVASAPPASTLSLAGTQGGATWYVSVVDVTLAATDPGGYPVTITYRINGGSWLAYAAPFQLAEGRHSVEYYATNAIGLQETSKSVVVDVDLTAPSVSLTLSAAPSASGWFKDAVDVTLVANDAVSGVASVDYRLDGSSAWSSYGAPFAVGEGRHIVEFRATDVAGLASSAGLVAIDVDGTSPVLEGLAPSGFVTTNRVTISWQGHDTASGLVGYEVSLDGGPFAFLGMVTSLWADFDEGGHNVFVKAVDAAGNEAVAVVSFRVDTNAFSPTGPYSGIPMFLILELVVAAVTMAIMRRRHKRRMALYG